MKGLKDSYFTTGKHTLCYQYIPGRGLPRVFLHGGTGSLAVWHLGLNELKKSKRPILLIDLFGHGQSSISDDWQDYLLEKHAQYILDLLAKLKLEKIDLVGHCLGSMIAATIAAKHPRLIRRLVLLNPGGFNRSVYFSSFTLGLVQLLLPIMRPLANRIPRKIGRPDDNKYIGSHELYLPRFFDEVRFCGYNTAINQFIAFSKWDDKKYYTTITAPTLVVSGKKDIIFNPRITSQIVGRISNAKHIILPTNHLTPMNMYNEAANLINTFTND